MLARVGGHGGGFHAGQEADPRALAETAKHSIGGKTIGDGAAGGVEVEELAGVGVLQAGLAGGGAEVSSLPARALPGTERSSTTSVRSSSPTSSSISSRAARDRKPGSLAFTRYNDPLT